MGRLSYYTSLFLLHATMSLYGTTSMADEVQVRVGVLSRGAKFIGTSMGGAQVTIRHADTGNILAQGITQGSTGDTKRIMNASPRLGNVMSSEGSAHYLASVDINEPTRVFVEAYGPLDYPDSAAKVSKEYWLIPNHDLVQGDGILLEIPGLVVDFQDPKFVEGFVVNKPIPIQTKVTMMCGCPLTPGGIWDTAAFQVQAKIYRDNTLVHQTPLHYAGEASHFKAEMQVDRPGQYDIEVSAIQPGMANVGVSRMSINVE